MNKFNIILLKDGSIINNNYIWHLTYKYFNLTQKSRWINNKKFGIRIQFRYE